MEEREGRSLAETPTWTVASVITFMVVFGFFFNGSLERFGKWLDKTKRKSLFAALDKIKEELMLFGVMSLLMGHWIFLVAKICVKSSLLSSKFFPCALESDLHPVEHVLVSSSNYLNKSVSRMQVKAGSHDYCPEGHESFASKESLEQLHRLMFVLGVTHVSYSFVAIVLAMIKLCFTRQFWSSINRSDYMALRFGFITMGARFKKSVVSENVRNSLSVWKRRVKAKQSTSSSTAALLRTSTSSDSVVDEMHKIDSFSSNSSERSSFKKRNTSFQHLQGNVMQGEDEKLEFPLCVSPVYDCYSNDKVDYHSDDHDSSDATMICIDNSEWMRNGDYAPSRFQAQADAVNLICGAKTQSNPENTVGVLTMAGKGVRVLVTPTSDLGKILACMHGLEIGGEMNLAAGIQVAQLALKHRQNKKQQQRIIVFAGSTVKHDKKFLEIIGRRLKKNSVALDIVNFGEEDEEKSERLEALFKTVNNNDTSHIVHVPPGPSALSDVLISTPIFTGDGEGGSGFAAAAAAAAAGGVSGFDFGVDPNLDPELALALRVSMEEERARQEAAAKKAAEDASKQEKGGEAQSSSQDATMTERASAGTSEADNKSNDFMDDENALLQQALAMSMDEPASSHEMRDADMSEATGEDPELALALQLSVQESAKDSGSQKDMSKLLADQSFVSSILASLPGVDPNDPSVKDLLASMQNQSEPDQKKNEDKAPKEEEK
ncbi:hypothetical protein ACE6H2_024789 [Prunus campanulata]